MRRTLDLYRAEFGEPPEDIWPSEDNPLRPGAAFQRVNTRDVWLLPEAVDGPVLATRSGIATTG